MRQFYIRFQNEFETKSIPKMSIYFTSEPNAYGVTQNKWVDGKVFKTDLEIECYKRIDIYPEKYSYIQDQESKCTKEESFYECFASHVVKLNFDGCPRKCLSMSLPPNARGNKIPICANSHSVALRATNARCHCALKVSYSGLTSAHFLVFGPFGDHRTSFSKLSDRHTKN